MALDIGGIDEVIVFSIYLGFNSKCSFVSKSKNSFCDIDPDTFNNDPIKLKDKITTKTKAIMVVHLFGLCAPMDEIKKVAGDIPLVEDGACAAGAAYDGIYAGGLGLIGCFLFTQENQLLPA